jgi:rare lipoprotein A
MRFTRAAHAATLILLSLFLIIGGCGGVEPKDGPPRKAPDLSNVRDAVPRVEPKSKYGNPRSYKVFGKRYYTLSSSRGYVERGIASWYGKKFHGRRTSNGETFNMYAMTAAHKTLPLPTYLAVTNLKNHRRVVVRANDRGPFHANRILDLSYAAASKLGILANGTVRRAPEQAPDKKIRLFLQVGAFSVRANADRLRTQLASLSGDSVDVSPISVNGSALYRVRIGPLLDVVHADRLTDRIVSLGLETPQIILE